MSTHASAVAINTITHHGWPNSYLISNGVVEAVVVPAVGRIMQFRFVGGEDTLWENRELDSQKPDPARGEWMNFGGDKCWPSPQSDWPQTIGRDWPPPTAFDIAPSTATIEGDTLVLKTSVDSGYGIQVTRRISVPPGGKTMVVETTYHKVEGSPVKVAVWTITQVRDPQRIFVLVPENTKFAGGFSQLGGPVPFDLKHHERMISLRRHPTEDLKIGTASENLLWLGETSVLKISSLRAHGEYPNGGSSAEVYTDSKKPYVELETTGALATMKVGDKITKTNSYELFNRTRKDESAEAKRVFGL